MWVYREGCYQDIYRRQLLDLMHLGSSVEVRGRKTMEIINIATVVEQPWHHCILIPSRRWNPWIAMSEALWILAGRNDVDALLPYNQRILDYSDDGKTLYGAYGIRIFYQIEPLIDRLRKDPSDRRAVLQIWDKKDLTAETLDPPCNDMVMFKLRDNKLHMTVMNRSNDIHWGLYAVNLPTFGILLNYISARLGVEMGTQTHVSNSLHVYTDEKAAGAITKRMMNDTAHLIYPKHGLVFQPEEFEQRDSHYLTSEFFSQTLDGKPGKAYPPFLLFADKFLRIYRNKHFDMNDFTDKEKARFADWLAAANIWISTVGHL